MIHGQNQCPQPRCLLASGQRSSGARSETSSFSELFENSIASASNYLIRFWSEKKSGWWLNLPSWKIWKSIGVSIPNIWENKTNFRNSNNHRYMSIVTRGRNPAKMGPPFSHPKHSATGSPSRLRFSLIETLSAKWLIKGSNKISTNRPGAYLLCSLQSLMMNVNSVILYSPVIIIVSLI